MNSLNYVLNTAGWILIAIGILWVLFGVYYILRKDNEEGPDNAFIKFVSERHYHYAVYIRLWRKNMIPYLCVIAGLIMYFTGRFHNFS